MREGRPSGALPCGGDVSCPARGITLASYRLRLEWVRIVIAPARLHVAWLAVRSRSRARGCSAMRTQPSLRAADLAPGRREVGALAYGVAISFLQHAMDLLRPPALLSSTALRYLGPMRRNKHERLTATVAIGGHLLSPHTARTAAPGDMSKRRSPLRSCGRHRRVRPPPEDEVGGLPERPRPAAHPPTSPAPIGP